ncbi:MULTISPECIES: hypothetical protein [Mesorhizobium]|uniref:hypothetical protein n=1 Tax=Mesorhizobium sp. TaxID=1871066 RepID=UPI000493DC28|nr:MULTISPECIES: hypothetical protein [Mesorhizobium]RWM65848.1 MAG: hypothetical protein EOR82_30295 [Mesorhizobium sp.]TIO21062.1 MAG: hypothetical protein E5X83_31045 [Mesorhizobium sp.]TJV57856.1 MAG: hypothetical protein E5X82_20690 [Mesorhizobium sp.]
MKQTRWLAFCCLFLLSVAAASAQTIFTLTVEAKGTFDLDQSYPRGQDGRLFNFHRLIAKVKNGEKINYVVFKPSAEIFKFSKSISRDNLFSRLEPCPNGVDRAFANRAQTIGGSIRPISGRVDLLAYLKKEPLIQSDRYIYVAIDSNLRNYVRSGSDFGSEWVPMAVQRKQLCLYVGVGRMGYGALASQPVNISRLADFVFRD